MGKTERIVLWVVVGLLATWLVVGTAMVAGELAAINDVLRGRESAGGSGAASDPAPWESEPTPVGSWGAGNTGNTGTWARVAGVQVLSGTLTMTVTVRSSGAGDLLYEPPVVVDETGRTYPPTGESLEAARYAFLDLVTRGQATAELDFAGAPAAGVSAVLVFNPGQQPDDLLAPRLEVPLPVMEAPAAGGTPAP